MKSDNKTFTKFACVPYGKACMIISYICVSIIAITGVTLLSTGDSIGFGILLFDLAFIPFITLMHFHNCANYITFFDDKIQSKRRTLTWDTAYLTVHCHRILASRYAFVWVYFDDHYLTAEEIFSKRVRKQGMCMRLNAEKTKFILLRCKNKVEILNKIVAGEREAIKIIDMFNAHNARL